MQVYSQWLIRARVLMNRAARRPELILRFTSFAQRIFASMFSNILHVVANERMPRKDGKCFQNWY